jgi:AcrR family transcriptional regulator
MEGEKINIKKRILEVAEVLFAQRGYDGISIDEIAKEANINKSMIYYYFSNKEGLLISIIQSHIDEFEAVSGRIQLDKSQNIHQFIREIITLAVDYTSRNRNSMKILLQETLLSSPKSNMDVVNFINPIWNKIESSLKASFPQIPDVLMLDKLICINLIINFILILERLDVDDQENFTAIKNLYIERVASIVELLIVKSGGSLKG